MGVVVPGTRDEEEGTSLGGKGTNGTEICLRYEIQILCQNIIYYSVADPFQFDMNPDPDPALNTTEIRESPLFFLSKLYFYDTLMILVDFCGNFP